jgi:predicted metal-binding protein
MTIRADILEAKAVYESHVAKHKCRAGEGNGKPASCAERVRLWREYMKTASQWGVELEDEARRKAFYGQVNLDGPQLLLSWPYSRELRRGTLRGRID